jgi:hypothetical protein
MVLYLSALLFTREESLEDLKTTWIFPLGSRETCMDGIVRFESERIMILASLGMCVLVDGCPSTKISNVSVGNVWNYQIPIGGCGLFLS